jgi:hypothetical protein
MSQDPVGDKGLTGIFGLFFREAGLFWEQTWQWAEQRAAEDRAADERDDERRRLEAEARFLEQARLAREAGLDVEDMVAKMRSDQKRLP